MNVFIHKLSKLNLFALLQKWLAEKSKLQIALKPVDTPAFTIVEAEEKVLDDLWLLVLLFRSTVTQVSSSVEKFTDSKNAFTAFVVTVR